MDAADEDEVGDELEAEATATYDSGDVPPVVRAEADAPSTTYPHHRHRPQQPALTAPEPPYAQAYGGSSRQITNEVEH